MIHKGFKILLAAMILSVGGVSAQEKVTLSLNEALEKAKTSNFEIKISQADYQSAKADYRQTNALILPTVRIEHLATATNNPLASFGYKLQQEIVQQADFNPASLNDPDNIENFQTSVILEQPIINVDGWHGRKAASSKMEALKYQQLRTQEHIELQVKSAYFGLQLADAQNKFLSKVVETVQRNYNLISNYYEQGLVKKDDLLEMEVRLLDAQSKKKSAEALRNRANNGLTYLLGMAINAQIENSDTLSIPLEDWAKAKLELGKERNDIQAFQNKVTAYEQMLKSAKASYLPRLNAFGAYNLNDDKLLGTNAKSWMVGAKLSLNVFDGYKTAGKVQKMKAELHKQNLELERYMEQQQRELEQAQLQLNVAKANFQSAEKAKESAGEAYRIKQNRYKEGLVKTTDLINAETAWSNKNLAFLNALYQYRIAFEYLTFLK
ncbi:TolC family protein [Prolixibacteraceae bacterium JC049]|nr:TolC family protein [Prolixibacteraceae bacterium JC049]